MPDLGDDGRCIPTRAEAADPATTRDVAGGTGLAAPPATVTATSDPPATATNVRDTRGLGTPEL
ncbi:MAG TPA: hypothetical protein VI248_12435 [Kineosporiaceae bacterium]